MFAWPATFELSVPNAVVDHGLQSVKFGLDASQLPNDRMAIGHIFNVIVVGLIALSLHNTLVINTMMFEHVHGVTNGMTKRLVEANLLIVGFLLGELGSTILFLGFEGTFVDDILNDR